MTALQEAAQYRSLYELTGDIKDLNTMLVPRTALAQQREQQPVCHGCGIPAGDVHMSTCKSGKWPSRVSNGDTAAPAPQTQDKSDNYLSGYCTGRTDLLKEQSAQPKQEPLTDEAIYSIVLSEFKCVPLPYDIRLARAIEAAHGITGMVEAATRPAIDAASKQGGQHE